MNKKILIGGSSIAVVVLVLASFSPVVGYNSVKSSVKDSPLFNIRTSRAINEESKTLNCNYLRKGELMQFPSRNSKTALIQKAINRMDDTTFDRFIDIVINHAIHNSIIKDEDIPKIVEIFYQLKNNFAESNYHLLNGNELDFPTWFYWTFCNLEPGCVLKDIIITLVAFIVIGLFFISALTKCITYGEECNPCKYRSPLTI